MIRYTALPTDLVTAYRNKGTDAFGNIPERHVSDGDGNPCRHCLRDIPAGAEMLVLAHKPFDGTHPYAEIGPIFLCADTCTRGGGAQVPHILRTSPDYLIKGYSQQDRIVYGTGRVVPADQIGNYASTLLSDPQLSYVHVRSARNNCYQLRIDRDV